MVIMVKKPDYSRYKSIDLLSLVYGATEHEKELIWAELSRRSHPDSVTGAISNNGPKEKVK